MKRILVIEDDVLFRGLVKIMLEQEGYDVILAEDGRKGLVRFRDESPDLVITDIIMPEQEGIETITMLRQQDKVTPIIAVSGGGRSDPHAYLQLAEGLGANKTFEKPFDKAEFLGAVAELLR